MLLMEAGDSLTCMLVVTIGRIVVVRWSEQVPLWLPCAISLKYQKKPCVTYSGLQPG